MQEENVMLVALISGNIILGEAVKTEGSTIQMLNPVVFVKIADEVANRTRDAMVPYAPFADNGSVLLQPTAIEYIAVPKQVLVEQYRSMLSGIALPPTKQIVTA